ncbi:MAG: hypothetical protein ACK5VJ_01305 [Pseudomonadota bacterium]
MNVQNVQQQLQNWYSPNLLQHIRFCQLAMLGFGTSQEEIRTVGKAYIAGIGSGGQFNYFPPVLRQIDQMSTSNPILKNTRILESQIRAVDMVPDWLGISEIKNVSRKAWWRQRVNGLDGYGGFKDDLDRTFMDFAMLGVGYCRVGVCEYEDGDRAEIRYLDPFSVISDPYTDIENSDGVGIVTIYGENEFEKRFPKLDFAAYADNWANDANFMSRGARVLEYYTHTDYLAMSASNGFFGEVMEQGDNELGCIPVTQFKGFTPPGSIIPIGLAELQLSSAQDIMNLTNTIRRKAYNDAFIAIEPGFFTPESLQKYAEKLDPQYLQIDTEESRRLLQDGAKPFIDMPRVGANADVMNLLNIALADNREQSAVSANAAGVGQDNETTATEVRSIDSRMDAQYRALLRGFILPMMQAAVKLAKVAERFDNAPFVVPFLGTSHEFNADNPEMTTETCWSGVKVPNFEEEELFTQDAARRKAEEVNKWQMVFQLTQNPEALKKLIESLGVVDVDTYVQAPQAPQGMPGMPGMEQQMGIPMDAGQRSPELGPQGYQAAAPQPGPPMDQANSDLANALAGLGQG